MASMIAYFSRRGENYVSGALRELAVGNTETAAGMIRELTGAALFPIEPAQAYSPRYNDCVAQAQADQRRDARPELKRCPESLEGCDTIYYFRTERQEVILPCFSVAAVNGGEKNGSNQNVLFPNF